MSEKHFAELLRNFFSVRQKFRANIFQRQPLQIFYEIFFRFERHERRQNFRDGVSESSRELEAVARRARRGITRAARRQNHRVRFENFSADKNADDFFVLRKNFFHGRICFDFDAQNYQPFHQRVDNFFCVVARGKNSAAAFDFCFDAEALKKIHGVDGRKIFQRAVQKFSVAGNIFYNFVDVRRVRQVATTFPGYSQLAPDLRHLFKQRDLRAFLRRTTSRHNSRRAAADDKNFFQGNSPLSREISSAVNFLNAPTFKPSSVKKENFIRRSLFTSKPTAANILRTCRLRPS